MHDLSKFLPSEWGPYARSFYDHRGAPRSRESTTLLERTELERAWRLHVRRNPHHWQHWLAIEDDLQSAVPMPDIYWREMVADWIGAGKAQGKPDIMVWYVAHEKRIGLHRTTRLSVESMLRLGVD